MKRKSWSLIRAIGVLCHDTIVGAVSRILHREGGHVWTYKETYWTVEGATSGVL